MPNYRRLTLLLWKNWLIQWRHKVQTIIEILTPLLFCSLIIFLRCVISVTHEKDSRKYDPVSPFFLPPHSKATPFTWRIAWSPNNSLLSQVMDLALTVPKADFKDAGNFSSTKDIPPINLTHIPFDSSKTLTEYLTNPIANNMNYTLAGVEFPDEWTDISKLPKNIEFKLRFPSEQRDLTSKRSNLDTWKTEYLFEYIDVGPNMNYIDNPRGYTSYFYEGFVTLQHQISMALIMLQIKQNLFPQFDNMSPDKIHPLYMLQLTLNRFPNQAFTNDILLVNLQLNFGVLMMFSFVYTSMNTVKVLTYEKERQLTEIMKIMGLSTWLHWTAWFIKIFSFLLIFAVCLVLMFKFPWHNGRALLPVTNAGVLFLFITMYIIASIFFCFMISAFFTKANLGSAVTGLVWFITYAPCFAFIQNYATLTFTSKLFNCLLSNTAMGLGFLILMTSERANVGLQWNNLMKPVSHNDNFCMSMVLIMLSIDCLIYLAITLYVEQILPGEFGVSKPWNFPCTFSFWGCKSFMDSEENVNNISTSPNEQVNWEPTPQGLEAGISIKGLRKVYASTGKVAVQNLNLDIFKNQITSLLGHNGAGKTTTMNMLTGMFQPTSGTATINGFDIRTNISGVRNSLGYCTQHNILFDELTVTEHLYFFSRLKGLQGEQINAEVQRYIKELQLEKQAKVQARHLSGGVQRTLSVAIAFCGGSKVVFCDEPTAGLDPAARKSLWALLQREKQGRTILLTTHFMDEADLLGDRIAIMAGGKLICVGSSSFLKKKFTEGFQLIITKDPSCDTSEVTKLLRKHIPSLEIKSDIGSELRYVLNEQFSDKFEGMLSDLEKSSNDLKLLTFQMSSPTLDDVFMKAGADNKNTDDIISIQDEAQESSQDILKGIPLIINQFYSMFMKKMLIVMRTWPILLVQIIIPLIFLTIALSLNYVFQKKGNDPPLRITLDSYDNTVIPVSNDKNLNIGLQMIKMKYKNTVNNHSKSHELRDIKSRDMNEFLLEESLKSSETVNSKYIVGATFTSLLKLNAWFNDKALHGIPLSLNLMHNAILKTILGSKYGIEVINYPLPFNPNSKANMMQVILQMGYNLGIFMGFSMCFVSSTYVIFIIKERVGKMKHLQFVSGVGVFPFWIPAMICDYMTFYLTILILVIYFAYFQEQGFSTLEELCYLLMALMMFGFPMLPITYMAGYFFSIPATGFVKMVAVYTCIGPFLYLVIHILNLSKLSETADSVEEIGLLTPYFAVIIALRNLNEIALRKGICNMMCENANICDFETQCRVQPLCCFLLEENYYLMWDNPGLGKVLTYLILEGIICYIVLFIIEFGLIKSVLYRIHSIYTWMKDLLAQLCIMGIEEDEDEVEDEDEHEIEDAEVLAEERKVNSLTQSEIKNYDLVMKNLTKYYNKLLAVNKINVAAKTECFGLLGSNGAGKTTVFKMITGDEPISDGMAWIKGLSVKTDIIEVNKLIGYCPQFHGLNDNLTGRENLEIFCLLRGIKTGETSSVCVKLAKDLNFMDHIDKKVSEYSGGNKRKISTAVALIGNPHVIYLDEPTAGMDISAKRNFWNAVCKVRALGRCIILTSNSMEECEILCNRLAIMVNGKFVCLGSTEQLKTKFSSAITLTIKVLKMQISANQDVTARDNFYADKLDKVKDFISKNFKQARLQDEYQCVLVYEIPISEAPGSKIFGAVNKKRDQLQIEDYNVGHTSLQQVFISYINKQRY